MPTNFKATIITLCYNHYELTNALLRDLHNVERENIQRVIVIDDASTDETESKLLYWKNEWPIVEIVRQPKNLGFTLSANTGLRLATQNIKSNHLIFLISNDVHIRGRFVQQTADILLTSQKHLVGNDLLSYDTGWNKF